MPVKSYGGNGYAEMPAPQGFPSPGPNSFTVPVTALDGSLITDQSIDTVELNDVTRTGGWIVTNGIDQTIPDRIAVNATTNPSSGELNVGGGIVLPRGRTITGIGMMSSTTAAVALTNQWACLIDLATMIPVAVTVDKGAEAWPNNTVKTFDLVTPYTSPTTRQVYVGSVQVGTTVATLRGAAIANQIAALPPAMSGTSSTGLTNPGSLPAPVAAVAPMATVPYFWVY